MFWFLYTKKDHLITLTTTFYKGFSLINSLCKIFINVLSNRLSIWAEDKKLLGEAQAGFRKQYSIIDNTFILQSLTQKYLSKNGVDFIAYLLILKKHLTMF